MVLFLIDKIGKICIAKRMAGEDDADTGELAHSILPRVSFRPWFENQKEERKFVVARSHLSRFVLEARFHVEHL
jgi:hypothetical protein